MTVAELSVRRPVTIVMVYILICVISCVFIPKLGIALYPKTEMEKGMASERISGRIWP